MKNPPFLKNIKVLVWDFDGTLYQEKGKIKKEIHKNVIDKIATHKKVSKEKAASLFFELHNKLKSSTQTLLKLGIDKKYVLSGAWYSRAQLKYLKKDEKLKRMFVNFKHLTHIMNTNSENWTQSQHF
ncbi:hypothetical protein ACFLZ1_01850 [Patescibacteria group bacterium]